MYILLEIGRRDYFGIFQEPLLNDMYIDVSPNIKIDTYVWKNGTYNHDNDKERILLDITASVTTEKVEIAEWEKEILLYKERTQRRVYLGKWHSVPIRGVRRVFCSYNMMPPFLYECVVRMPNGCAEHRIKTFTDTVTAAHNGHYELDQGRHAW